MTDRPAIDGDALAVLSGAPASVISDALDRMGRREQVLDLAIRPLWPEARLAGVAVPVVVVADTSEPELPYDGELTALDGLRPGDVPLFAVGEGVRCASWGELFSCAALGRGAAGVVIDGYARDAAAIKALGFPAFARGLSPLDTFARAIVTGVDVEARVGGVEVEPGDFVVGDVDGIVVIPKEIDRRRRGGRRHEAPPRGQGPRGSSRRTEHQRGLDEVRRPLSLAHIRHRGDTPP